MHHLKCLGTASIQDANGAVSALSARRHAMGLLALLATSTSRSMSRSKLVGLFWPDSAEQVARNRLNNCVHQVRSVLGDKALASSGDELRLSPEVGCDVGSFEAAIDADDHAAAVAEYGGVFLDGFQLSGSVEFDDYVEGERERLAQRFRAALERLAEAAGESGHPEQALQWWRRLAQEDRYDARITQRLMEALDASGSRAESLRVARAHGELLEEEFGAGPDPQVQALVRKLMETDPDGTPAGQGPDRPREQLTAQEAATTARAIAVLPFENISGTPEADPFAAGLHDDLLTELSGQSGLRVIARLSVLAYRGSNLPPREIARALGVDSLLVGAVQSSGGRLRLNVQLIDAASGSHLWAERYERMLSMDSLFEIQSDLVAQIARSLRSELVEAHAEAGAERKPTDDLEAYRLRAQGQQHLNLLTHASLQQAVAYFRQALERDPDYALAWVGLGDACSALVDYGFEDTDARLVEADAALQRALVLMPDLPQAHAAIGKRNIIRRNGPAAIAAGRRALELMPHNGQAHDWMSWVWQCLGRPEQALQSARQAVALEPLLSEAVSNLSVSHLANGHTEEALAEARRVRELAPGWTTGTFYEALALYRLDRFKDAQSALQGLVVEWAGNGPRASLALACIGGGALQRTRGILVELEQADDAFSVGLIRLALGETAAAFEAFDQVADWGQYWPTLAVHHYFPTLTGPLANDARFRGMRAGIHRAWGLSREGEFPG